MRGSAGPEERACARENICGDLAVDSSVGDQREDAPCKLPAQTKSELKVDKKDPSIGQVLIFSASMKFAI